MQYEIFRKHIFFPDSPGEQVFLIYEALIDTPNPLASAGGFFVAELP